jgi:hypothetical protein
MKAIERRLHRVEGHPMIAAPARTMAQINARLDELLAKIGTTQEQVIAKYGSLEAYALEMREQDKRTAYGGWR